MMSISLLQAVQYAQLAYLSPQYSPQAQFIDCDITGLQAYVQKIPENHQIIVYTRGTDSLTDAYHDLQATLIPLFPSPFVPSPAKVHQGFHEQYMALAAQLDICLCGKLQEKEDDCEKATIIFCGHSLGGAVSTIMAICTALKHPRHDVEMYSFGSPPVGNEDFAKLFQDTVLCAEHIINGCDPIPKMLCKPWYHHVVAEPTRYGRYDYAGPIPVLFDMCDHDMKQYVKVIQKDQKQIPAPILPKVFSDVIAWFTKKFWNIAD